VKWIYNFRIKTKLLSGFFIVIFIVAIMGYIGINNIKDVRTKYNSLYEEYGVPLGAIGKANRAFEQNRVNMRQSILETDAAKMDGIVLDMKNKDAIMDEELNSFSKNIETEIEKNDYNNIRIQIVEYKKVRDKVVALALANKNIEARDLMNNEAVLVAQNVSDTFTSLIDNTISIGRSRSDEYLDYTDKTVTTMVVILLIAIIIASVIGICLSNIIEKPIKMLMEAMSEGAKGGELKRIDLEGKDEICEMSKAYSALIEEIKMQIWSKEGQTKLTEAISGDLLLTEFTQKTVSFLSQYLNGGSAVFYVYNETENNLKLFGSYAFTERDRASSVLEVGEGTVGQVIIEKQPILLKNIRQGEAMITTGLFSETPLNTFSFPLIYENETLGVIEIASFEPFDHLKQKFITEASNIISTNLYVLFQSEKVKQLLKESEKANIQLELRAEELQKMNTQMEEQQQVLQQQAEELQQSNTQMEEQQQMLQQQAEELQQTNTQLEEQQQMLQQQSEELNQTNTQLEEQQHTMQQQSEIVMQKNENLIAAQVELEKRAKELENSNKYKSQFLANMSHELRTPLNSIILLSKLLLRSGTSTMSEKDFEKVGIINKSGNELLTLINEILDLSKLEAGKIELNITTFSTTKLVEEFKEKFSPIAQEKGIEFICEDKLNIDLKSDRERISQIISNFLSNAFKFTEKGQVYLKIASGESEEVPIAISVKDTGIGILKAKQKKIFEAFEQMDGSISRKYGGTGLGLYISEEISNLLKGKIKVISEEGDGSEFILFLPNEECKMNICTIEENGEEATERAELNIESQDEENLSEIKDKGVKYVLIASSEETQKNDLKELLETDEIRVLEVSEEEEAIEIIEKYKIEVAIIDIHLKNGSEIVLCNYIKQKNINIPIIIYTSKDVSASLETENELKKYADSIIIKTVNSFERLKDELLLYLYGKNTNKKDDIYLYNKLENIKSDGIRNKNILIVDDDPKNIFVLAAALEDFGGKIIQAENGVDALEKIETEKVDLILMDIMMPVMDGYECISIIRTMDRYKDIPIIALTAKALKGDREKCIEVGANDYISKPVDYDVLINLISAWINK